MSDDPIEIIKQGLAAVPQERPQPTSLLARMHEQEVLDEFFFFRPAEENNQTLAIAKRLMADVRGATKYRTNQPPHVEVYVSTSRGFPMAHRVWMDRDKDANDRAKLEQEAKVIKEMMGRYGDDLCGMSWNRDEFEAFMRLAELAEMPYAKEYLRTPQWSWRRDLVRFRDKCCQRCGSIFDLQVHHLTYDRRGLECADDLVLLCRGCHETTEEEKKAEKAVRWERERREKAINTYMTKRFGLNWEDRFDWADAQDLFDDWVERKEDDLW